MNKKGLTPNQVIRKCYQTYAFDGSWLAKMGKPEVGFSMMVYGSSASGKSTEIIKLGDYLATNFGSVYFNSWEEGIRMSLASKLKSAGATSTNLRFFDTVKYEDMIDRLTASNFKFVIIDSIQYMGFSYLNYRKFRELFPEKSLILISQVNRDLRPKGAFGEDLLHAVDIKAAIFDGYATYKGRYLPETFEVDLFNRPKKKPARTLFNQ